ncbi:MAG TPA: transcriptional regulator [Cyanothece sp. UBA12306]|nr:transcriptional regulator [Cyanothece sp. UBA12306]
MSRKKPSVNLPPEQSNNHSPQLDDSSNLSPNHGQARVWRRLIARAKIIRDLTKDGSQDSKTHYCELDNSRRINLKVFKQLLGKIPWRKKTQFDSVQVQREILQEIGFKLYHARREQGLSLEEIEADTCISLGSLRAIENGNLEYLPEPIYIRGMIKKFANYLGLDAIALADSFPTDIAAKSTSSTPFQIWLPTIQLRPIHLYFLYIIIVILSVQGISNSLKRSAMEMGTQKIERPSSVESSPNQSSE